MTKRPCVECPLETGGNGQPKPVPVALFAIASRGQAPDVRMAWPDDKSTAHCRKRCVRKVSPSRPP